MSSAEAHRAAEEMVRARLEAKGIGLEPLPDLPLAYALLLPGGGMRLVKLLAREAPHRRGGGGDLGLHWLLRSDLSAALKEDYVALVDLSREMVWLMPAADFRSRALPQTGGRWHLDWLVARLSPRSRVADEAEFEEFTLERAIAGLAAKGGAKP